MSTFWLFITFVAFIQSGAYANEILIQKLANGVKYKGCSLKKTGQADLIPNRGPLNTEIEYVYPDTNSVYGGLYNSRQRYGYGYAPNSFYGSSYGTSYSNPQVVYPEYTNSNGDGNVIYMDGSGLTSGGVATGGVSYDDGIDVGSYVINDMMGGDVRTIMPNAGGLYYGSDGFEDSASLYPYTYGYGGSSVYPYQQGGSIQYYGR